MHAERDARCRCSLGHIGGRGQDRVDRAVRHVTERGPAREVAPRESQTEPAGDRVGELDVEAREPAAHRVGVRATLAARGHGQIPGGAHRQRLLPRPLGDGHPPDAFGPEHVGPRLIGGQLPVVGESVRVRETVVAVRRLQGLRDRPAIPSTRTEGREQHPSHIPALGAEDAGRRSVRRLEVVDEPASLQPGGRSEVDARARDQRAVPRAGSRGQVGLGHHRGRPHERNGAAACLREPGAQQRRSGAEPGPRDRPASGTIEMLDDTCERVLIRELRRRHDPGGAEVGGEQVAEGPGQARPVADDTRATDRPGRSPDRGRHRRGLVGRAGDRPAPRRPPVGGERGIQLGQAERRHARGVQQVTDGGGLRPERADHRRHVGRIVRHLLRELVRLRVVTFYVQPHHLGDDRQIPAFDRLLERELHAEECGSHRLRRAGNGHVVQERDLHRHRVGDGRGGRAPTRARGRQGREQGDQGGGDRGASAHVGPVATHARTRGRMGSLGPRRDGGTGRRAGLKIPWASAREGSTPSPGTQTTRPSTTRSPRSNRSSPSDEMSTVRASPSTTSSAMSLPTTGACWNP